MAPRGRKPKPTHLKLVEGNRGKRRLNRNEPQPESGIPDVPSFLYDEAKVEWGRVASELYASCGLSRIDRAMLAAYCQQWGRWVAAEKALAEFARNNPNTAGLITRTTNGNVIQNPLVGIANVAAKEMVRVAAELGMSPAARSRIDSELSKKAQDITPAAKFLANRPRK